jgi:hypothetical protein
MPKTLTPEIALAAIAGLELQKTQIDSQIAELRNVLDGGGRSEPAITPSETGKPRKKRSAAVRRRMKIAQQLRWKKIKEAAEPPQSKAAKPKKRKLSAAGRKNIIEATKRRWALKRAESEKLQSATTEVRPKRKISAAARRKMAAGAKKRWAAKKAA